MSKKRYKCVLADLDGTVNRGSVLIPGAAEVYQRLSQRGVQWMFLSNNATVLAVDLAERIERLGLSVRPGQMINSASALIYILKSERPDATVFVVGERRLATGLEDAGVTLTLDPREADIVVSAMDRTFTYEKLEKAQNAIYRGAEYWATNLDPSLPVEDGVRPGSGSISAAIATAAGRPPDRVMGKPEPCMAHLALELLDATPEECVVVGDRMETDILFARNAGIDSVLVLTGATDRRRAAEFDFSPDYIINSIADLESLFE